MTYEEALQQAQAMTRHSIVYINKNGTFDAMAYGDWLRSDVHPFAIAWNSVLDRDDNALLLRDARDWASGEFH